MSNTAWVTELKAAVGFSNWRLQAPALVLSAFGPSDRSGFSPWPAHISTCLADASWTQRLPTAPLAGFLPLRSATSGLHLSDRASLLHAGRAVWG